MAKQPKQPKPLFKLTTTTKIRVAGYHKKDGTRVSSYVKKVDKAW
jgi:hypothetical protein